MDLWSVRFEIQDNFKNIFSEYVEDFEGYISSSLFVNDDKVKKKHTSFYLNNVASNKFGEFHQNQIWVLEVFLNQKPDINTIIRKLNYLAKELKTAEYFFYEHPKKDKYSNRLDVSKIAQKNWLKLNRKSFPIINIDNFYIYGTHNNKNCSVNKIPINALGKPAMTMSMALRKTWPYNTFFCVNPLARAVVTYCLLISSIPQVHYLE